jgi:hypothetical protein
MVMNMSVHRNESHSEFPTERPSDRREHLRIRGPFDGIREGLLDTPVRVYDLSRGGCFITSLHEQQPGIQLTLHIDIPGEGVITVIGETLARQNEFGYAVRFVDVDSETAARLYQAIERLAAREPDIRR